MSLLPDHADDFAAYLLCPRVPVGHETLGRGNDGDAETPEHLGDRMDPAVGFPSRGAHFLDPLNGVAHLLVVLEEDFDDPLPAVINIGILADEMVFEQDSRDLLFDIRCGNINSTFVRPDCIPNPSEHVRYMICQHLV